ncbi:MAG: lipoyl synthase [Candidatus Omnitrophica bacterium]|nr:lipoyl synthase [Candidatus Omnitrophota bacterium]HOX53997.1 lipoyl synthase [Candidatus Omnitrophota bacterium]
MIKTLPSWLKKEIPDSASIKSKLDLVKDLNLHTVCVSAHCPNMGECFSHGALTFMILGDICTRNCQFCAVRKGMPGKLDINEPQNIARAVKKLNLDYVVITSVTRDDLSEGGASVFAETVKQIKNLNPDTKIELLIPDFQGNLGSLGKVMDSSPDVIGHNIETVERLYQKVRPMANYRRSLGVLNEIRKIDRNILTKSAILLGMGETWAEIIQTMQDLKGVSCDILAIGQYLAPSNQHLQVAKFVSPDEFKEYKEIAEKLGFKYVLSGPFVRSSYLASELLRS